MKIAILAPENSPSWGGVGAYSYNLILNLPKNVEIHVITLDREIQDSYDKIINAENITFHKILKVNNKNVFSANFNFQIAVFKNLKKLNKIHKFDVIHTHSGHLPHFFSQFQNIDSKFVLTPHGETKGLVKAWKNSDMLNSTERISTLLSPIIEKGEKISFSKADKILPVSQFTLNQIEKLYNINISKKSNVIYNGVDVDLFNPTESFSELDELKITFVGRFYAIKGINIFLEAIKNILDHEYKIKCILVGRGNEGYLKKYLDKMPRDSYSILGRVNHFEMKHIYDKSDVIVLPSIYEACPSTLLEAMACGKTVIASNVGGIPEIIDDKNNGILFEPNNPVDLKNKLIPVIEGDITPKIRQNARKTVVEKFNWKNLAEDIYHQYLRLING